MSEAEHDVSEAPKPAWCPLEPLDRRVLGVLVEKAKTTPEAYPLSLNALRTGCNQKNNRHPLMEVELDAVEQSLERLRALGAVAEVQGGGRVSRFRHRMYEWMGVEKVELAVMAELLLRGAQTEGELRGRAARMEPIADLAALRPVLDSLKAKGLILSLSPPGRGHVLSHALYLDRELEKLKREAGTMATGGDEPPSAPVRQPLAEESARSISPPVATAAPAAVDHSYAIAELREQLEAVRNEVASLRKDLDDLWSNFR
jgi:uncharacterized protein YceH (UPF0502 family)